jgi:serine/threonine protein kinase
MSQTRYQILGTIGVGASSRVDKARDTLIDRTVVLKTIGSGFGSPELQKQFLREAQILGRLSHPNIISVYDFGNNDDGSAYLVTEYVPGKTLEAVLAEQVPVPLARAGLWAGDLASALSRAHKAGVIHGDVKPANIFVTDDGQIKLGDFGIARFATQVSGSASLVGTPAYLSPEQIKGETQDHRSDIFSIGIVLYQLTTGIRPFDGSSVAAVCAQIVAMQPPPPSRYNPALPKEFDRIVMRCLTKDPNDRYASGESLAASLYPFARNKPQPAPPRFDFSWFKRPLRPSDKWIYGSAVAAALVAIPVVHNLSGFPPHAVIAGSRPVASPANPVVAFASPDGERSSASQAPQGKSSRTNSWRSYSLGSAATPGTAAANPGRETLTSAGPPSQPLTESSPRATTAQTNKMTLPASPQNTTVRAAAPAASLGIEITSVVESETLAIFIDQQLVATSALSVTRPGESLRLDRALPAGPHELRIALYRQDKTLQIEKQGLAELQPGAPNLLAIHVVRRAKMLVKRGPDLEILWPSAAAAKSGPDHPASKPTAPLVANSLSTSR